MFKTKEFDYIGKRIGSLRKEIGLSQVELARSCNLTPSIISQIEKNKKMPSVNLVVKIASGLGVPVSILIDNNDQPLNEKAILFYKRFGYINELSENNKSIIKKLLTILNSSL